jgi:hypothetical protein
MWITNKDGLPAAAQAAGAAALACMSLLPSRSTSSAVTPAALAAAALTASDLRAAVVERPDAAVL